MHLGDQGAKRAREQGTGGSRGWRLRASERKSEGRHTAEAGGRLQGQRDTELLYPKRQPVWREQPPGQFIVLTLFQN